MLFLNRLTGQKTKELPETSILGQWQILTESDKILLNTFELSTNSQAYLIPDADNHCLLRADHISLKCDCHFPSWQMPSEILLDSLLFFAAEREKLLANSALWQDLVKISPLVPGIEEKINIQSLEKTIKKYLGHLEEVCRHPRSYLKLEIEKLPVSRAQRISSHAMEFLASHTEDWQNRTFRSIVPKKVLCMVREELWDIYENQVTVRLIDNLLLYINRRIQQIQTLKKQLEEAEYLSGTNNDIYWRNKNRIYTLWGNQVDAGTAIKKATATLVILQQLQQKLRGLLDTNLYKSISKNSTIGRTLKRTNILINDQHYRYVDLLWREWNHNQVNKIKTARQVFEENQQLFNGFEFFCLLLLAIALTGSDDDNDNGFGFKTLINKIYYSDCNSLKFTGALGEISLNWQVDGSFLLQSKGILHLRLIPLLATFSATNNHKFIDSIIQKIASDQPLKNESIFCILYPGTEEEVTKLPDYLQQKINFIAPTLTVTILPVSPLDILSVERIGRMIQGWLNGQRYQSYPPDLQVKIPDNLVTNPGYLEKSKAKNQFWVLRQLSQQEEENFKNNLAKQIAAAKAPGRRDRGNLQDIQELQDLPHRCQELIQPLQVCPVCYSTGSLNPLSSQSFCCSCSECNSSWGTRICGSCSQKYPFIQLQRVEDYIRHNSLVNRTFGRDILAVPCSGDNNQISFICPHCHKCS